MKKLLLFLLFACTSIGSKAQLTLFNGSFEDTLLTPPPGATSAMPQGWRMGIFGSKLSPDAVSGKFAAIVWNWYYYGKGTLINGSNNSNAIYNAGTPISFRPNFLTGTYKYIAGNNGGAIDSAIVYISLVKYNSATQLRDTIGRGTHKFPLTANYVPFQTGINYINSQQPDTIIVQFISSIKGFCGANSDGNCLYLYLDDLAIANTLTGVSENLQVMQDNVYPNPAGNQLFIPGLKQGALCTLQSPAGQILRYFNYSESGCKLENLDPGLYFVRIEEYSNTIKFLKE